MLRLLVKIKKPHLTWGGCVPAACVWARVTAKVTGLGPRRPRPPAPPRGRLRVRRGAGTSQEGSHAPLEPVRTRPFDAHGTLARRAGSGRHARRQSRGPWAAPEAETVHAGRLRGLACKRARHQSRPFRRGGVSAWSSAAKADTRARAPTPQQPRKGAHVFFSPSLLYYAYSRRDRGGIPSQA